ncbi:MAG: hypothetical protein ABEJ02_03595 [Candidatus Paceibacteria bacterium]
MAFSATHLKFAAHKQQGLSIENKDKYYSGTVYPDSRYVTGIAREKTHFDELLPFEQYQDDFKLGWAVHYLCDQRQGEVIHDVFDDLNRGDENIDWWVEFSAIKLAQDYFDRKNFELLEHLQHLNYTEINFEGEKESELTKFLDDIKDSYRNFTMPRTYERMLETLEIDKGLRDKILDLGGRMVESKEDQINSISKQLFD